MWHRTRTLWEEWSRHAFREQLQTSPFKTTYKLKEPRYTQCNRHSQILSLSTLMPRTSSQSNIASHHHNTSRSLYHRHYHKAMGWRDLACSSLSKCLITILCKCKISKFTRDSSPSQLLSTKGYQTTSANLSRRSSTLIYMTLSLKVLLRFLRTAPNLCRWATSHLNRARTRTSIHRLITIKEFLRTSHRLMQVSTLWLWSSLRNATLYRTTPWLPSPLSHHCSL